MDLHHISFDIPYPPNYGGVMDVFYKISALAEAGVRVHLHAFEYSRPQAEDLLTYCASVHYYPRKKPLLSPPVKYPHIVKSRNHKALLKRLRQDNWPILFEGMHTTYFLSHPDLEHRVKIVRLHNIEWEYYYQLGQRESKFLQKQYYLAESRQLQAFENTLPFASHLLTISPKDTTYYQERFRNVSYLPAFHPHRAVTSQSGRGEYCLYHGKLSVSENHEAAMFLIYEVFDQLDIPLVIAGSDPQPELISAISNREHIRLVHNPGEGEMSELMRDAHIHVLPTFQATGIKLKLLNGLFSGRFVIANSPMVHQTGLEFLTTVANEPAEFRTNILALFKQDFTQDHVQNRRDVLKDQFSNRRNAEKLKALIDTSRPLPMRALD
ncbi:MAG: glycosyltransferase [Bacteroidota bacterium]